jgi:hypothetical protein
MRYLTPTPELLAELHSPVLAEGMKRGGLV